MESAEQIRLHGQWRTLTSDQINWDVKGTSVTHLLCHVPGCPVAQSVHQVGRRAAAQDRHWSLSRGASQDRSLRPNGSSSRSAVLVSLRISLLLMGGWIDVHFFVCAVLYTFISKSVNFVEDKLFN